MDRQTTGLPITAPGARVGFEVAAHGETRVRVYGWGEHPEVPSPGHLLLVAKVAEVGQVAIMLRGRDMASLGRAVAEAEALYAAEAEYLTAPVTRRVGGAA